jgi:hypothetical protein
MVMIQYAPFAVTKTTVDALVAVTGWGGSCPGECPATALTPSSLKAMLKAGYVEPATRDAARPEVPRYRATQLGQMVLTLAAAAAKVAP